MYTVLPDTGWSNNGLAFMFGLLSVQWTMTDYDAGTLQILLIVTRN